MPQNENVKEGQWCLLAAQNSTDSLRLTPDPDLHAVCDGNERLGRN